MLVRRQNAAEMAEYFTRSPEDNGPGGLALGHHRADRLLGRSRHDRNMSLKILETPIVIR
jgi:hypothetical protein